MHFVLVQIVFLIHEALEAGWWDGEYTFPRYSVVSGGHIYI